MPLHERRLNSLVQWFGRNLEAFMTYIGYFVTALMIVAGFCGLNEILFAVSSEFGMPTTIGGLGWALDHAVLGSPVFQALGTAVGFVLSFPL
jgi:hypothetical protein